MRTRRLCVALASSLVLSMVFAAQAFAFSIQTVNPDDAYLARTTKLDFASIPESTITSITTDDLKVTFDQDISNSHSSPSPDLWGDAGAVEDTNPMYLYTGNGQLSMQTDRPVTEFGVEVTPSNWGAYDVVATFVFSDDGETVGQVSEVIDAVSGGGNWKAKLFAIRSDVPFDQVDVSVSGGGLMFSQLRYGDFEPVTLSGTVKSAAGTPVPFASVAVQHGGNFVTEVQADYQGKYSLELVPADYTFYIAGRGWGQVTEDFTVPEQDATKDFTLTDHYEQAVYRFFNMKAGVHFYTANDAEFINTRKNLSSTFSYDGIAYFVPLVGTQDTVPLYRFFNAKRGVHFFTASEAEKNDVIANHSDIYTFEGVAYRVRIDGQGTPVYRFYVPARNTHFYTTDTSEIMLSSKLSDSYHYEGIGYWVGGGIKK